MQEAFYIPTKMSSVEWFCETAIKQDFSEQGLAALKLYLTTLPKVQVDISNYTKIKLQEGLERFIEVYEFNEGQYIVSK